MGQSRRTHVFWVNLLEKRTSKYREKTLRRIFGKRLCGEAWCATWSTPYSVRPFAGKGKGSGHGGGFLPWFLPWFVPGGGSRKTFNDRGGRGGFVQGVKMNSGDPVVFQALTLAGGVGHAYVKNRF